MSYRAALFASTGVLIPARSTRPVGLPLDTPAERRKRERLLKRQPPRPERKHRSKEQARTENRAAAFRAEDNGDWSKRHAD